ncbi:trans-aconitate 2-methyltransferase [Afipia carboxidovorans OM5]|uniref:Trans-aconitate 2-methyltransferase n=1 Tax=Afipia carboxidovorans (strain ATCC 49405 / DSM 1227 / KCTC 32145 / OM5) TaxID=504832 RepID=TAM_AFIC5|nr:trans-aconitate 2-methyltransferase [Afipia carboxidovorans]B6JIA0.1 RecName: Full=Trans-aconitate 2-methyltransferase [Afipia carboxidovorans OM5]ACI94155.1 trans-aconitate 2-methyltransferase [Afipia carboxidovorans OM5]AEI02191.1 trans-aconitate 2-methyltransferase Tam [Afipia carboxidovorans OM4]AEI05767.1 trans-aconitate 2-methyltransferase Tam [Afipia carboxidovorans OM5]
MADWSAEQYLKFEDERTRPARDLLAQIPRLEARQIADIGCGPGNSTELLARRWPQAKIIGIDTSADMLRQARERLPDATFIEANVAHWVPPAGTDILFANAIFQWVPDHLTQFKRLAEGLPEGGVLAVQMPDNLDQPSHALMRQVAQLPQFRKQLAHAAEARAALPHPSVYYDALRPLGRALDIWHTVYHHALDDAAAIVEWVKGTGLRPFLDPLDFPERKEFLEAYTARIAEAYPPRIDGKVLLRFPRFFIVLTR